MFDAVRDQIARQLAARRQCVLCTGGITGVALLPVTYCARGLSIDCLLPLWAEVTFLLEQDPQVTIAVPPASEGEALWLQILGTAAPVAEPEWATLLSDPPALVAPADLYRVVRVRPARIDLLDGHQRWYVRETLELL